MSRIFLSLSFCWTVHKNMLFSVVVFFNIHRKWWRNFQRQNPMNNKSKKKLKKNVEQSWFRMKQWEVKYSMASVKRRKLPTKTSVTQLLSSLLFLSDSVFFSFLLSEWKIICGALNKARGIMKKSCTKESGNYHQVSRREQDTILYRLVKHKILLWDRQRPANMKPTWWPASSSSSLDAVTACERDQQLNGDIVV